MAKFHIGDMVRVNVDQNDYAALAACQESCGIGSYERVKTHAGKVYKIVDIDPIGPSRVWYNLDGTGLWWREQFLTKGGALCPFK